nr:MAG: hypothetical protein KatS3mg041_2101 [Bacteroidota bacterium]
MRQLGAMSLGRVVALGGALLVAMVLSRLFDPAVYGQYRQIWLLYGLLGPAVTSAISMALYAHLPGPDGSRYLRWAQRLLWLWGGWVGGMLLLSGPLWAAWWGWEGGAILLWSFVPYMVGSILSGALEPVFMVRLGQPARWVRYNLAYNLAQMGAILIPAATGGGLIGIGIALSTIALGRAAYALYWYGRAAPRESGPNPVPWPFLRYLGPLLLLEAVGVLARHVDQLITSGFFDARTFALYHNGAREVPLFTVLFSSLSALLVARLSPWQEGRLRASEQIRAAAAAIGRMLLPPAAFLFVFAETTMVVLYGPEYRQSASIFRLYLLLLPLRLYMPQVVVLAAGRNGWLVQAGLLEILTSTLCALTLLPALGWWAPAVGALAGNAMEKIVLGWWICRRQGLRPGAVLPPLSTWGYMLLGALAAEGLIGLHRLLGGSELIYWAFGAAMASLWALWAYHRNPVSVRA